MASPGLVFAKRKKTPFRGPMLSLREGSNGGSRSREPSVGSRSGSVPRRKSVWTVAEGDEDEQVEEVEVFSPLGEGEVSRVLSDEEGEVVQKLEGYTMK